MLIYDRNGNIVPATVMPDKLLKFMYGKRLGKPMLWISARRNSSRLVGTYMNSPLSRRKAYKAVKKYGINLEEYEKQKFKSYNDFFTRKIKPSCRPVDMAPEHLIAPCDSKLRAFTINAAKDYIIKGAPYTVSELLGGDSVCEEYIGGLCLIFRLSVDDYHRYCYIDKGTREGYRKIKGVLYTVSHVDGLGRNYFKRNSRVYTTLHTENFGDVIHVEVGATLVGRIRNRVSTVFDKGDEKGYFEFGGSTIVLLIKKGVVELDEDIIRNSLAGNETQVRYGSKIGKKITSSNEATEAFKFFIKAFSPETYGVSMGRAADTALVDFSKLSQGEQQKGTDYILRLFTDNPQKVYGKQYLEFIELYGDKRFLESLEKHRAFLIKEKPFFETEIKSAQKAIDALYVK